MTPDLLNHLRMVDDIAEIDLHFGQLMLQLSKSPGSTNLLLAAVLTSRATRHGHICLNINHLADKEWMSEFMGNTIPLDLPDLTEIVIELSTSGVVGSPGDFQPLILDTGHRLYLYRYWDYQRRLAEYLVSTAGIDGVASEGIGERLRHYFPEPDDWQRIAATVALLRNVCVIAGGPGTGKTRTVCAIIALFIEHSIPKETKIQIVAPTGKAAVRLQEAVRKAIHELPDLPPGIADAIPRDASTIHRMLGTIRNSPYFRYNKNNKLDLDLLIIDEASMVDLALMAKVIDALPARTKLILLGDSNQLASVEAGAVLADICSPFGIASFSQKMAEDIAGITGDTLPANIVSDSGLHDGIVELKKSYRFADRKGIGELAGAINNGEAEQAIAILQDEQYPDVSWRSISQNAIYAGIIRIFETYQSASPSASFAFFDHERILCAVRSSPLGVRAINTIVDQAIRQRRHVRQNEPWYAGQPVLITQNDYQVNLFNGDLGILLPNEKEELFAFFIDTAGDFRAVRPFRLPEFEPSYAMTVHKSQGSEFDKVILILPDEDSRVLTRELLYTAVTRASQNVEIWASEEILRTAIARKTERASGLGELLWGENLSMPS
jgi:exodeoxyribonuclease V alpha subunit